MRAAEVPLPDASALYQIWMGACASRSLSRLARSCIRSPEPIVLRPRNPADVSAVTASASTATADACPISALTDDLLVECLSRLPLSSLPSLSLVCRRFSLLLDHPSFLHSRRLRGFLYPALLALSSSSHVAFLPLPTSPADRPPRPLLSPRPLPSLSSLLFPHPRVVALGRSVYLLSHGAAARLDAWTNSLTEIPPAILPHYWFAAAALDGRIYVAGGSASGSVEEYDPVSARWRVVAEVPRKRYGCVGAGAGGVFYVIGGMRIRDAAEPAHAYAPEDSYTTTMDAYDVQTGAWMRTPEIPGAEFAVDACAAGGKVYVLATNAVEASFWRWEVAGKGCAGEWRRLRPPPVPGRVARSLRYSCVGVEERTVVVVVHAEEAGAGAAVSDAVNDWEKGGVVLLYDIEGDEWSRGCSLPPEFGDASFQAVEC